VPARKRRSRPRRARNSKRAGLIPFILASVGFGLFLLIAGVYLRERKPKPVKRPQKPVASENRTPKPSGGNPPGPTGLSRVAERYNAIVSRSGGRSAWLKHPAYANVRAESPADPAAAPTSATSTRGEVLALPQGVTAVLADLKRQAATDGLEITIQSQGAAQHAAQDPAQGERRGAGQGATTGGPAPEIDVTLAQSHQNICAWRIRQVPRLYRAAIVIDDLGQDIKPARRLMALPYALTFSVLPHLRASRETSTAARLAGREVMLHLPMEPLAGPRVNPGEGAILVGMRAPEVARIVEADLETVPNAAGVNNHMGSRATSDPAVMAAVMKELSARRLYFIDSRTAPSTVALKAARQAGIPAFYRSVFLDDTETVGYTLGQLRSFRALVERQGAALAIGHPHPTTISALETFLPELERDDIELVPASQLVNLPEVARLSPGGSGSVNGD
jgi:polysaccharide deacetylase 2 family uncharacterized protein YibQ